MVNGLVEEWSMAWLRSGQWLGGGVVNGLVEEWSMAWWRSGQWLG